MYVSLIPLGSLTLSTHTRKEGRGAGTRKRMHYVTPYIESYRIVKSLESLGTKLGTYVYVHNVHLVHQNLGM